MTDNKPRSMDAGIAYFSMEIGLESAVPTYSGGLGVLAGDTLKSAADLELPLVGISLLYRQGYFRQHLEKGWQQEETVQWDPSQKMQLQEERVSLQLEGRKVLLAAWRYDVRGEANDYGESPVVPVYFLDSDLPENAPEDRALTGQLYGGDAAYRLKQEAVLGIGGVRMLAALGYQLKKYHLNEGHASLLLLELLHRYKSNIENVWDMKQIWNLEPVRNLCVFTTHTPVEAGHDRFDYALVESVLRDYFPLDVLRELAGADQLNMTTLGLNLSRYHNGVAKKHGVISQNMFPGYDIRSITNGVHTRTWTHPFLAELYTKYLPNWSSEPEIFVRVDNIPDTELWDAHQHAKRRLLTEVQARTGQKWSEDIFTVGFARRATPYKRASLLLSDLSRLRTIGKNKLQIIYAGKAHPADEAGKQLIHEINEAVSELGDDVRLIYLENYEMELALQLVAGVDVWLNTPQRPREASGTSGMKAAHNGVPNFSVLDGWWIEGHIEGVTGWSIGPAPLETQLEETRDEEDVNDLYEKLEKVLLPLYENNRAGWIEVMKGVIGKNACYFNTHRMMRSYVTEAYIR
jgi:starch phosphorylase